MQPKSCDTTIYLEALNLRLLDPEPLTLNPKPLTLNLNPSDPVRQTGQARDLQSNLSSMVRDPRFGFRDSGLRVQESGLRGWAEKGPRFC